MRQLQGVKHVLICAVAAAIGIFAVLEWFHPYFFLKDDNLIEFLPSIIHYERVLFWQKTLPLFNYYLLLGNEALGQGQYGILYPPRLLSYLLSRALGNEAMMVDVEVGIHLVVATIFMFLLLRTWNVDARLCGLGALVYSYNGFMTVLAQGWVYVAGYAAWLPAQFYLVRLLISGTNPARTALLLGTLRGMAALDGYIQLFVYACSFEFLFFILSTWTDGRDRGRAWGWYLYSVLLSGVLAAPLVLPMMETYQHSSRHATDFLEQYLQSPAYPDDMLNGSILPYSLLHNTFGSMRDRFVTMHYNPISWSVVLAALAACAWRWSRRHPWLTSALVIVSAGLLLGDTSHVMATVNLILPRAAELLQRGSREYGILYLNRWNVLVGLAVTVACLVSTFGLRRAAGPRAVLVCMLLWSLTCAFGSFSPLYHLLYAVPIWNHFRWPFKFLLVVQFLVTATAAVLLQEWGWYPARTASTALACTVAVGSILYVGTFSATSYDGGTAADVQSAVFPHLDTAPFAGYRVVPVRTGAQQLVKGQARSFSSYYEVYNWTGYEQLIDREKEELIGVTNLLTLDTNQVFETRSTYLRAYGVRWYLCPRDRRPPEFLAGDAFKRHPWGDDFWAFEDSQAEPIIHRQGDKTPIPFHVLGNTLHIEVPDGRPGNLIVGFWYPNNAWRVQVDGRPVVPGVDSLGRIMVPLQTQAPHQVEVTWHSSAAVAAGWCVGIGTPLLLLAWTAFRRRTH